MANDSSFPLASPLGAPVLATDAATCSCAAHDPVAAAYEAARMAGTLGTTMLEPNTILSTEGGAPLVMNAATQAPIPDGMQFYLGFRLDWQGDDREEFQVLAKVTTPQEDSKNQILLWQFFGTTQVQLVVTVNGVEKSLVVDGIMVNSDRQWVVQVTDAGQAQLFIDGALRGEMAVGDIGPIPRDVVQLGGTSFGFGNKVWGEYTDVRADVNGDGLQDIVTVPPVRLPTPFTPAPIPDLPNPNPTGFTNTAQLANEVRVFQVGDTGNTIIDAIVIGAGWKGDTITFAFNVQDIDNNGIADFDEGGWRAFYTGILTNVTQFTGVDFWERPEGVGTIEFALSPGGGGASGTPGLFAAPSSGTIIGISGSVADAGRNIGSFNFTHTWFHEAGHALGMAHPHEYVANGIDTGIGSGGSAVTLPGDHFLNSKLYSSTTYSRMIWGEDNPFTAAVDFGTDLTGMDQSTYLPFDIAALQHIYGVNSTFALGDDLYRFNDSGLESRGLRTIWDNGGIDTIQYTGSLRSVINLNDATIRQEVGGGGFLSTSEALDAGFLIAKGVVIENAIGGEKQDFITGNEVANRLTGNGGDDILRGGDGNDSLYGGAGSNTLDGGSDMDVAFLTGARADYTWAAQGDNRWVFTHVASGAVNSLRDVETVQFEATGERLVLSATAFAPRALEITQPPPVQPGPPFVAEATVRFDNVAGGQWQRVFDFGNGAARDNILLTQVERSGTMRLEAYGPNWVFNIEAPGAIIQGETATWRAEISALGNARLFKNGVLVAEGKSPPLPDVPRANLLVGQSNWGGDTPLIGQIVSLVADINGDGVADVRVGTPPPLADRIVQGTASGDVMGLGYADAQGDRITDAADSILGNEGNDTIGAGGGNDSVDGGVGNDSISGEGGADSLAGGAGNDIVLGGDGADTLVGGAGDSLFGGADADSIVVDRALLDANGASRASITVDGGAGADVLDLRGAGGWRIVSQSADGSSGTVLFLDAAGGATGQVLTFTGIETILGTPVPLPNRAPVVSDEPGLSTQLGKPISIDVLANDRDPDGNALVITAVSLADPADGTVAVVNGRVVYTPSAGAVNGTSEIRYTVSDGQGGTGTGRAFVWVNPAAVQGDGIVQGPVWADVLGVGYGDAQGDRITDAADTILGGNGNDTISAGGGNDLALGGGGSDSLSGGGGADTLQGDAGGDTLRGGDGDDTLLGGDGNDALFGDGTGVSSSGDQLYGGTGDDTLVATEGAGAGFSYLDGGIGNDQMFGGAGDDSAFAGEGADYVQGNAGNDTLNGWFGDDDLRGNEGDDVLLGEWGNDYASGGAGADRLAGGDGSDTLQGDAGGDTLLGGEGYDVLVGGAGNDSVLGDGTGVSSAGDQLYGGDGDDTLVATERAGATFGTYLDGGIGNDQMFGGSSDDSAFAGEGNDYVQGNAGNDTLNGWFGDDDLRGNEGDDVLLGEWGNDYASGGAGADRLTGGDGSDTLQGDAGGDSLLGGDGFDVLLGGEGNDSIFGDGTNGSQSGDQLYGGDGDDTLVATEVPGATSGSYLDGGIGNDQMFGGSSDDSAFAGEGNDYVQGNAGNDTLSGWFGDDDLRGNAGDDSLLGDRGNDFAAGGDGNDTLSGGDGVDNLQGEAGDDSLSGDAGNDYMLGGAGVDTLQGGLGDDTLDGGVGADSLAGGAGNDYLAGDLGNDTLVGGAGDRLFGGADADRFVVDRALLDATGQSGASITVDGGAGGMDADVLDLRGAGSWRLVGQTVDGNGNGFAGTVQFLDSAGVAAGQVLTFTEIETILGAPVTGPNRAPVVSDDPGLSTQLGKPIVLDVLANDRDPDGNALLITGVSLADPTDGTAAVVNGRVVYTPSASAVLGTTEVRYTVSDGFGGTGGGTAFVWVNPAAVQGDGIVQGAAFADWMAVGYGDAQGDRITDAADSIMGNGGNDTISAGGGSDTVDGGAGDDILTGGAGVDQFVFKGGRDRITDMAVNEELVLTQAMFTQGSVQQVGADVHLALASDLLVIENFKLADFLTMRAEGHVWF